MRAFAVTAVAALALVFVGQAFAAVVTTDSYPYAGADYGYQLNSDFPRVAQSFTANVGGTLDSAKFWLAAWPEAASGSCYAELWAITGTYGLDSIPTGVPLATSASVDVSSLALQPNWQAVTFQFDNNYTLTAGTQYAIVAHYENPYPNAGAISFNHSGSSSHSGNSSQYWTTSGSWSTEYYSANDVYFEVYVNDRWVRSQTPKISPDLVAQQDTICVPAMVKIHPTLQLAIDKRACTTTTSTRS